METNATVFPKSEPSASLTWAKFMSASDNVRAVGEDEGYSDYLAAIVSKRHTIAVLECQIEVRSWSDDRQAHLKRRLSRAVMKPSIVRAETAGHATSAIASAGARKQLMPLVHA